MVFLLEVVLYLIVALIHAIINSFSDPGVTRQEEEGSGPQRETARRRADQRIPETAQRVAVKLRGTVQPHASGGYPFVRFTIQGHAAQVQWGISRPYTRVVVDMKDHSPGLLKIFPPTEAIDLTRRFGMKLVRVGNKSFDARFVVKSDPEDLSARVFAPEHRGRLLARIRLVPGWRGGRIDLSRETFSLFVPTCIWRDSCVLNLVGAAAELVGRIREVESSSAITQVETAKVEGGECQVCGTEIREGSVSCARCRTPHHEECWRYLERCSTFGCGETRTEASG